MIVMPQAEWPSIATSFGMYSDTFSVSSYQYITWASFAHLPLEFPLPYMHWYIIMWHRVRLCGTYLHFISSTLSYLSLRLITFLILKILLLIGSHYYHLMITHFRVQLGSNWYSSWYEYVTVIVRVITSAIRPYECQLEYQNSHANYYLTQSMEHMWIVAKTITCPVGRSWG